MADSMADEPGAAASPDPDSEAPVTEVQEGEPRAAEPEAEAQQGNPVESAPVAEEPVVEAKAEGSPPEAGAAEPVVEAKADKPTDAPAAEEPVVEAAAPVVPASPGNLGTWAFVLAMLGLIGLLPIIGSVLGFVLGRVAIRQADSRRVRGGRGLAVAAVTISVISLVVIALGVAAYALVIAYLEI